MSRVEDSGTGAEHLIHVRSRWQYMRQRLKRRGVVEVGPSHPRHDMLAAIQVAVKQLFSDYPEARAKKQEELDDGSVEDCIRFDVKSPAGKSYTFESYATPVFAGIRAAVDIQDEDFLSSLTPDNLPYLEFISNSRSGQDFYFTNNQRFVLKTDKEHCIQYFISILREYLNHFQTFPHSLLVKFHGLYSIKSRTLKKRYFLVMQSIFYPTIRLEERFDIKGCMANRYQDPNPSGRKTILVLKDKNFLEERIEIGAQRDWFLKQLRADVDFLLSLGVLDYSLLLGRHPLVNTEKRESVGNLVLRLKKSFGHEKDSVPKIDLGEESDTAEAIQDHVTENGGEKDGCTAIPSEKTPRSSALKNSQSKSQTKTRTGRKVVFLRSLSDKVYLDSTELPCQNRRLLLNCENNLHIIDGVKYRYFIGVIDFFTQFQCRQCIGKLLKDIKTCCGNHSTEMPDVYAERFYQFISERVV